MNHDCQGDWVPSIYRYRCLLDGSWIAVGECPKVCPNCKRKVDALVIENPQTRTVTTYEVLVPNIGWLELPEHTHVEDLT